MVSGAIAGEVAEERCYKEKAASLHGAVPQEASEIDQLHILLQLIHKLAVTSFRLLDMELSVDKWTSGHSGEFRRYMIL